MTTRGIERDSSGERQPPDRPATDGGKTSLDDVLRSLANPTRRFLLYYLQDHEIATREQLAREVVAWQTESPLDEIEAEDLARMHSRLAHVHLPDLAALRFIEFDPRSETVRYSDPPALLEVVLRLLARIEDK